MRARFAGWLAGAALAAWAPSACATVLDVTYSGVVAAGSEDSLGLFGGGSLAGDPFSVAYAFDTSKGSLLIVGAGYELSGGSFLGGPTPSAGPAIVTINGHAYTVSGGGVDDYLGVDRSGMTTIMDSDIPSGPHLTTQYILDNTIAGYTLPFAPSANMGMPFSATGNSHVAYFAVFAPGGILAEQVLFDSRTPTEVDVTVPGSAAPEPTAWAMLLLGVAGVGGTLRTGRRTRSSAGARAAS
jgi:hypothetical protein